jgi:IS4 transposase
MARRKSIAIRDEMASLLPDALVRQTAHETGAVKRERKIDIVALFWTLVLGFGIGGKRTFTSLREHYFGMTGLHVVPSSFWDRFTPALARFFKQMTHEALDRLGQADRQLSGCLESFRDLVLTDASVIRLHEALAGAYPGTRTNHSKAAAKLHLVWSALGVGRSTVKISGERGGEIRKLQIGPWVERCLLLFDLGYFRYQLFDRIDRNGGYFVSRLKGNANPRIVSLNRLHRGRAVKVVGRKIREVLPLLKRQVLDVQAEVTFDRRAYRGVHRKAKKVFRLVAIKNEETGEYHLYLTNAPPDVLPTEQVGTIYRARWYIELMFKELKSGFRMDQLPSRNKSAVEVFIYASILAMLVSRKLLRAVRDRLPQMAHRISDLRWASVLRAHAGHLLAVRLYPEAIASFMESRLSACLLRECVDPHLLRPGLLEQVETAAAW